MPRPVTVLTAASALLFIASATLSVRSRWAKDQVFVYSPVAAEEPVVIRNMIYAITVQWDPSQQPWMPTRVAYGSRFRSDAYYRFNRARSDFALPGFEFRFGEAKVAHWLLSVIAVPLPMLSLFRWVSRSKRYAGRQCVSCGYDIRASTDRCPECGTPVPTIASPVPS